MKPNTTGKHRKIQPANSFDKTAQNNCFFSDLAIKIAVIMSSPQQMNGLNWFHFLILVTGPLVIRIGSMTFYHHS